MTQWAKSIRRHTSAALPVTSPSVATMSPRSGSANAVTAEPTASLTRDASPGRRSSLGRRGSGIEGAKTQKVDQEYRNRFPKTREAVTKAAR